MVVAVPANEQVNAGVGALDITRDQDIVPSAAVECVVAEKRVNPVVTGTAAKHVVSRIAGNEVVERIARPSNVAVSAQDKIFNIVGKREEAGAEGAEEAGDGVETARTRSLNNLVAGMIDDIAVAWPGRQ